MNGKAGSMTVNVAPTVAIYLLNQKRKTLALMEGRFQLRIVIAADASFAPAEHQLERVKGAVVVVEAAGAPVVQPAPEAAEAAEAVAEDDEEEAAEAAAPADTGEEASKRSRRRRPRRRRRTDEETRPLPAQDEAGGDAARPVAAEAAEEAVAGADAEEADADAEAAGADGEAEGQAEAGPQGDARKRRRRGKRGGRRRPRRDDHETVEAAAVDAEDASTEGAGLEETGAEDEPLPLAGAAESGDDTRAETDVGSEMVAEGEHAAAEGDEPDAAWPAEPVPPQEDDAPPFAADDTTAETNADAAADTAERLDAWEPAPVAEAEVELETVEAGEAEGGDIGAEAAETEVEAVEIEVGADEAAAASGEATSAEEERRPSDAFEIVSYPQESVPAWHPGHDGTQPEEPRQEPLPGEERLDAHDAGHAADTSVPTEAGNGDGNGNGNGRDPEDERHSEPAEHGETGDDQPAARTEVIRVGGDGSQAGVPAAGVGGSA